MSDKDIRTQTRCRPSQTVASFLLKTFEILQRSDFEHIISWDTDEEGFVVKNLLLFTNEILPKYFRHSNFSSFVRQLNMYDFHKIKQNNDNFVFKNPLFRKGGQHLLKDIKRKASKRTELDRKVMQAGSSATLKDRNENSVKEAKQLIEVEVVSSSNLFEKSISLLEAHLLSMYLQCYPRKGNSENLERLQLMAGRHQQYGTSAVRPFDCMETLYLVKKACYQFFSSLEGVCEQTESVCNAKLQQYTKLTERTLSQNEDRLLPLCKKASIPSIDGSILGGSSRKATSFRQEAKVMGKGESAVADCK